MRQATTEWLLQLRDNQNNGMTNGSITIDGSVGGNEAKHLSEIDVSLAPDAALQICLVALGLALLSSAADVVFITKYEPMKILSERN